MIRPRRVPLALGAGLTATAIALAAGLLAAGLSAQAATTASWRVVASHHYGTSQEYNGLFSVVAPGRRDAWAFGGRSLAGAAGDVPVAEHWNGRRWRTAALPRGLSDEIVAASAPAPNDIWTVSRVGGYVLHWNGTQWSVAKRWPESENLPRQLTGVTALGPGNVWVFGGSGAYPGLGTWHLRGGRWTRVTTRAGTNLGRASALSPRGIWAIGGNASGPQDVIAHYNGAAWRTLTSPVLQGVQFSYLAALSRGSVWATGSTYRMHRTTPWLGHLTGHRWSRVRVPWRVDPGALSPDGRGGLWIAAQDIRGSQAWALHLSRSGQWSRLPLSRTGLVPGLALIPGTTSLFASGVLPTRTGADAAIWAYGQTR
ncbi:MAG: hypothetical protein ACLPUO_20530 [Streptosporangiaceae bacterium]|jgi:hypothetical protein